MSTKENTLLCEDPNINSATVDDSYIIGNWHSKVQSGEGTYLHDCQFYKNGTYECEYTEHGPMSPGSNLYHADILPSTGTWLLEGNTLTLSSDSNNNKETLKISKASNTSFKVVNNEFVIYYRTEDCAKSV
ncbi:hypothetical protein J7384_18565 [Endozoicomonas sp. G2_1]|uniref:hypothetical protein n=1 Tax=Endozoicomonas sp. G2_1 TaxID=2821091 RepID=UPI001ADC19CA|nr:hypothetical protein [Endozoicomonas sp. G2_1]MBO9492372.1 hypothetical protein [Endozoicomonas sp. G2_1]